MTGLQISMLLMVFALAIFFFFAVTAVVGGVTQDRRRVDKRIVGIRGREISIFDGINQQKNKRKKSLETKAKGGSQSAQKQKLMNKIFNELVLADIMMRPEEFCMAWLVIIVGPASVAALLSGKIIPAIALAVIGAFAPIFYISTKKKKRVKAFEGQLSDALMIICNSLRSGLSFQQALETIAVDMPPPISIEFSRVTNEIKYGSTLEDALNHMVKRVKSSDLLLAVSAVNIQRQTGGNLSYILDTIADTIKERLRIKGEINSLTAQGKISGLLIGGLPVAVAGVLFIATPDYMSVFFTTTAGKIMMATAIVMEVIGFMAIRKVVTIEY